MKLLRITDPAELYRIVLHPGDLVEDYPLHVGDLLGDSETVSSAVADDLATVPTASGSGRLVLADILAPANGVQQPVRITVRGSLGSVRHVALLIIGLDPYAGLVSQEPNIYLRWRGAWSSSAQYVPFDLVLFNGVISLALKGSSNVAPDTDTSYWLAWAASGGRGGAGGAGGLIPDRGGSGRYAAFELKWEGPGKDDWAVKVVGVEV